MHYKIIMFKNITNMIHDETYTEYIRGQVSEANTFYQLILSDITPKYERKKRDLCMPKTVK